MAGLTSWLHYVAAVLVTVLIQEVSSETCPVYSNYYIVGYKSCGNGCCGSYPDYYCCALSSAAMAGIVLGGIVVICLIVFLCAYCVKKKKKPARVVRPAQPTTSNTIVFTGASGHYPGANGHYPSASHHHHHHMPMPPPYKRHDSPPPYAAMPTYHPAGPPQAGMGAAPNQAPGGQTATQSYPYGMRPMGASAEPPAYNSNSATPSSSAAAPTAWQYGYGQGQGWSAAGNAGAPSAEPSTGSSPSAPVPAPAASSSVEPASAPHHHSLGPRWPESASNRNTVTTRILPSRLPPLPNH